MPWAGDVVPLAGDLTALACCADWGILVCDAQEESYHRSALLVGVVGDVAAAAEPAAEGWNLDFDY